MRIYIDADACPVVRQTEIIAEKYNVPVTLICDTNHLLNSMYSEIVIADAGADSVDIVLVNKCGKGDIVVSQDYGVAAMALGKGAFPIHQNGKWYTNDNIDELLMQRHMAKTVRRSHKKSHLKGPKKRREEDNQRYMESLEKLIIKIKGTDEN